MDESLKARVLFGLEAQGHIPAVEKAISEGLSWAEIGKNIGWCGDTAKIYYDRYIESKKKLEPKRGRPSTGFDKLAYNREYMKDKRLAAKLGMTVKQFRSEKDNRK